VFSTGHFLERYRCVVAYTSEKQRRHIAQNINQPTVTRRCCRRDLYCARKAIGQKDGPASDI
jgi:hypothetical protein